MAENKVDEEDEEVERLAELEKWLKFFDLCADTTKWRTHLMFLCFQCVTGIAAVIVVFTDALGSLAIDVFTWFLRRIAYFDELMQIKTQSTVNTTVTCERLLPGFNAGISVFSILMIVNLYIIAKIYVYTRNRYLTEKRLDYSTIQ